MIVGTSHSLASPVGLILCVAGRDSHGTMRYPGAALAAGGVFVATIVQVPLRFLLLHHKQQCGCTSMLILVARLLSTATNPQARSFRERHASCLNKHNA